MTGVRRESRWRAAIGPAAVLVAAGLWTGSPVLLLAAVVPLGFLAYGAVSTTPDVGSAIALERSLGEDAPLPGEHVTVELRVTNEGDATLPDLRVVDGVPGGVAPIDGEAAAVLGLRPGESATVTYTLLAQRGKHEFGPVRVRSRSLSGSAVSSASLPAAGDSTLFCRVHVADAPIRDQTRRFVGAIPTTTGGAGIEFHSTRAYRRGDPVNRIDWRRLAKTGELTTVDYRIREAARVLVVVDARDAVDVSAGPASPRARELSSYAAELLAGVLLDESHEAGVAVFGMDLPGTYGSGSFSVRPPGSGETVRAHLAAICEAIGTDDPSAATRPGVDSTTTAASASQRPPADDGTQSSGAPVTPDGGSSDGTGTGTPGTDPQERRQIEQLVGFLDGRTQVLFVTPALDEFPIDVTETLQGHGHRVTVLSPDLTDGESLGGRLARLQRGERIDALRGLGARVVDWSLETPLPIAVANAFQEVR